MENNICKLKIFHCHVTRGYPLCSFCAPVECGIQRKKLQEIYMNGFFWYRKVTCLKHCYFLKLGSMFLIVQEEPSGNQTWQWGKQLIFDLLN